MTAAFEVVDKLGDSALCGHSICTGFNDKTMCNGEVGLKCGRADIPEDFERRCFFQCKV